MDMGSLDSAKRRGWLVALGLTVLVILSIGLLTFVDLSRPWTAVFSIVSAVAGALLGNYVRHDYADSVVVNQARPAMRHLFQQIDRLRAMVIQAEGFSADVAQEPVESNRISDWFGTVGSSLRNEIEATAGAIENWGDLTPSTQDAELKRYQRRMERLPSEPASTNGSPNE